MKQVRSLIIFSLVAAAPLVFGGTVSANTQETPPADSITQELRVTAKVPDRREIIIDQSGTIVEITSNTLKDIRPTVYIGSAVPKNKKPLTPELYKQYRTLVAKDTAKYGVLYQRGLPLSILRPSQSNS